jgi:hypothetical protein
VIERAEVYLHLLLFAFVVGMIVYIAVFHAP